MTSDALSAPWFTVPAMGVRDWFRAPALAALEIATDGPSFAVDAEAIDPAVFGLTSYASAVTPLAPRVTRQSAIQVPAVKRSRDLVAGSLGTLPVVLVGPDRRRVASALLSQPEAGVPRSVTMTRLVEDMLFEKDGWWRIVGFDAIDYPASVSRMAPKDTLCADDPTGCPAGRTDCSGAVTYKGKHIHDAEVIRFPSPNDALLVAGARAIRTCLALESSAHRYADGSPPMDYFTPDGVDPEDDEVTEALDAWAEARRTRSTGYVPKGLKYNTAGWSPEQLEMGAARQEAVLEIARLAGVDAEELGVSTTSRTYANQFDRRKSFTDFTLGAYISAIQDRLSMPDVTPAGYLARFDLTEFQRSDDLTRFQAYQAGLAVGAYADQDEVRDAEGKPPLNRPTPPPSVPVGDTVTTTAASLSVVPPAVNFSVTDDALTMDTTDIPAGAVFSVDVETRTIRGRAVPYGVIGHKAGLKFQFSRDTIHPREGMRVKLWALHEKERAAGVVKEWNDTDEGLDVAFQVAKTPAGDIALANADALVWDGLSIGPSEGAKYVLRDGVYHSVDIPVHEISLTPAPVFGGAKVNSVTFDAAKGTDTMTTDTVAPPSPAAPASDVPPPVAFDATTITDAIAAGFANLNQFPQSGGVRPVVDPTGAGVQVREELPYRFDGVAGPHSFTADIRSAYASGDNDARVRLEAFIDEAFAVTTANVASMNPTQNRPELYVPNLPYSRPLWDLVSTGVVENQTPFTIPRFTSASGLVGNHTQGVEPTPGSFVAGVQTVTPAPMSGKIEIVREVWDQGGNPQTDAIIWGEMLNGWYEAIEAKIAALLATTATAELNLAGAVDAPLVDALTAYFAGLQFVRGGNRFTATAADSKLFLAAIAAKDSTGRKLLPVLGATNAQGETSAGFDQVNVGNQKLSASWALAAVANTRSYNFVPSSVWFWASAPKRFTFEYQVKSIDMAIWGYGGGAILRDSDVKPIDYDTADV
jgi:hypothetical protein